MPKKNPPKDNSSKKDKKDEETKGTDQKSKTAEMGHKIYQSLSTSTTSSMATMPITASMEWKDPYDMKAEMKLERRTRRKEERAREREECGRNEANVARGCTFTHPRYNQTKDENGDKKPASKKAASKKPAAKKK